MNIKNEVAQFLRITEQPKSKFCSKIGISITALNRWLKDEINLSDAHIRKMQEVINNIKTQLL